MRMSEIKGDPRWGLLSVFPKPMPIRHNAKLFPRLFSTNKSFDVPYLPYDEEIAGVGENRSIILSGSLCFEVARRLQAPSNSCIVLYNQTAAWFDLPYHSGPCRAANASWISGWWPARQGKGVLPVQPKWAPYCYGPNWGQYWPWTGCQSHKVTWAHSDSVFTFSPAISTSFNDTYAGSNYTDQDPNQVYSSNPFDNWLLCGVNGSCMNLEPMAMIAGGAHGISEYTWSSSKTWGSFGNSPTSAPLTTSGYSVNAGCSGEGVKPGRNVTYKPTPVCVYPPFVFIVSNKTTNGVLKCSNDTCFYAQCWDAKRFDMAVVARMPRWIPVPVEAPNVMTLYRQKRDFGITAAIVTAISLSAVGATAAAIAMSHTIQTAHTLNNLSSSVARALDEQTAVNAQLKGGLMVVNQRIDLVQEQIDVLWQLAQLGCQWKFSGLCVTSIQYENFTRAANYSKQLSKYLLGNWSAEFDMLQEALRREIVVINSTRVDASLAKGLTSWITSAVSHFKEWAGVIGMGILMCGGFVFLSWLLCRLRAQQRRDKAIMVQAMAAIELGTSSQAWLNMLKERL